jgi:hypothetical protein
MSQSVLEKTRASIDLGRRWNGSHSIQKVEVEER